MKTHLSLTKLWIPVLLNLIVFHASAMTETKNKIFSLVNGMNYTEIPFRFINDLIIIPVTVNGELELNFMLDTGTNSPVFLHERYIKTLSLDMGRQISFQGAGSGKAAQGTVISGFSLQIGDAYAFSMGGVLLKNSPLSRYKIDGTTIHGIIGTSLFRSFAVEIDYLTHTIRLHEDEAFLEENTFSAHTMQIKQSRPILLAEVLWEDAPQQLQLMIDTGFNNHLLIYDKHNIDNRSTDIQQLGMGYSGKINGSVGSMPILQLGQRKLFNVHTFFPDYRAYKASETTTSYRDGIIGNALLKQFCVVLDYAQSKFYIREHLRWNPMIVKDNKAEEPL